MSDILDSWEINYDFYLNKLKKLEVVTPKKEYIFRAFSYFRMQDTKVVILGQDPYPDSKHAMGLSFSSNDEKTPASLRNIFKVLTKTHNLTFKSNNLEAWAKQGVLLLNTYLTYPGKYSLWDELTNNLLKRLTNKKIIYMLWGNDAIKKKNYINGIIYEFCHPSPMNGTKFLDCDHFIKTDGYIKERFNIKRFSNKLSINGTYQEPQIIWDLNFVKTQRLCIAFTDGSWRPNYKTAAWAVYFPKEVFNYQNLVNGYRRAKITESYEYFEDRNHIMAEGIAIMKTLEIFVFLKYYPYNIKFVIVTDSELWYNGITKGYNFKDERHKKTFDKIVGLLQKVSVDLYHVTSHGKEKKIDYETFYDIELKPKEQKQLFVEFQKHNVEADKIVKQLTY